MDTSKVTEVYRISFCTTCMNRLHHLCQTLPANLSDNSAYENVEFVVLNYNSKDGMDAWMERKMMNEIKSGKIKYIKTLEPLYFKMSHAKNMVTKFATGDIVCNIDADNFTGGNFAKYVNEQFNIDNNIFLTGGRDGLSDLMGRVCLWKSDFLKLRGYDEKILDYGYEDLDFYARLRNEIGRVEIKISHSPFLKAISHDQSERMKNGIYNDEIEFGLTLNLKDAVKALILKKGNKFECITLIPGSNSFEGIVIDKKETRCGTWMSREDVIQCKYEGSADAVILSSKDAGKTYLTSEGVYRAKSKLEVCFYYSLFKGQMIYEDNLMSKSGVNENGYGEGLVFEPFI